MSSSGVFEPVGDKEFAKKIRATGLPSNNHPYVFTQCVHSKQKQCVSSFKIRFNLGGTLACIAEDEMSAAQLSVKLNASVLANKMRVHLSLVLFKFLPY